MLICKTPVKASTHRRQAPHLRGACPPKPTPKDGSPILGQISPPLWRQVSCQQFVRGRVCHHLVVPYKLLSPKPSLQPRPSPKRCASQGTKRRPPPLRTLPVEWGSGLEDFNLGLGFRLWVSGFEDFRVLRVEGFSLGVRV